MFYKKPSIAVIGDGIIDEYYYVNANKISPEFPIPIMSCENLEPYKTLPGGACNVCYQFYNFESDVRYFGLLDQNAKNIISKYNICSDGSSTISSKIPRKKRFYQDQFPLCRLDIESKNYNLNNLLVYQNEICNSLKKHNFDIAIFSDYNKGVFNNFEITKYFDSLDSKTLKIVDPKCGPINRWKGCDLIKPNSKESKELTGKTNWKDQAEIIKKETNAKYVVITQGGEGVVGIKDNDFFEYYPEKKIQSNSVIGAGDCFITVMSLCLFNNFDFLDSIRISFLAGSIYVKNKYNKPIHPLELFGSKLVDQRLFNKRDFTVCFTNGCFDLGLTSAHIECLKFAKSKADKLVVGLNSDQSVSRIKGENRPILPFKERAKILEGLECVDYIIGFGENTPIDLINCIKPDLIVKGGDYKKEDVVGFDKFPVEIFNLINCTSTSDKIKKIYNI